MVFLERIEVGSDFEDLESGDPVLRVSGSVLRTTGGLVDHRVLYRRFGEEVWDLK